MIQSEIDIRNLCLTLHLQQELKGNVKSTKVVYTCSLWANVH